MSPVVAIHLAAAVPAVLLGGALPLRRKGNTAHRILGRVYVVLLLIAGLLALAPGRFLGTLAFGT